MRRWESRITVVLWVLVLAWLIAALVIGDPALVAVGLVLWLVLIVTTPRQRDPDPVNRRPLPPVVWFGLGGLVMAIVLNQTNFRAERIPFYDDIETSFNGQIMIPESFIMTVEQAAGVTPGASCVPILQSLGRWKEYGNRDRPSVIARDGENRVLTFVPIADPVVLEVAGETEVRCGYAGQVQSTVRGSFVQFEVNGRNPDVIGGSLAPTNGQYRELRPLTPGDGRPLTLPPEITGTPTA